MNKTAKAVITATVIAVLILAVIGVASAKKDHKVTICHATSSETNPWVRTVVDEHATSGHFNNNGTTKAGHEGDVLLAGDVACPVVEPTPTPTPTPEVTPTPTPTPTPGPVAEEPTGCPYGDGIPVDSEKCVAPVDYPVIVSADGTTYGGGK